GELTVSVRVAGALHPAAGADRRVLARAAESAVHLTPPRAADRRHTAVPAGEAVTIGTEVELGLAA
ncbi:hypothetical protein ACWEVO_23965, partial [Micromonospora sp. NPDC003776]